MGEYMAKVVIPDGELDKIMGELEDARDTIYRCYKRLEELGVLRIESKDTVSGN